MNSHRKTMIFHVAYALDPSATSASGIRPRLMRQAFEAVGYEVLEISGTHLERRRQIRELKSRIRDGLTVDFVYSEASTHPTGLGEKVTLATSLTRDIRFLQFCRVHGVPVGLYYRDVYWRFPEFLTQGSRLYRRFLLSRYRADLRAYLGAVDHIYLQSLRMAEYLPPENRKQVLTLPPGAECLESASPRQSPVSLFYVGGIGDAYYRMQEAVRGVELAHSARLTMCTRENEWREVKPLYEDVLGPATQVVHRSGEELTELYDDAHLGVLFMEPVEYRDFVLPFKLFEYLGRGKPIVATEGTLVGDFVAEHGIGWTVPYNGEALAELLDRLAGSSGELAEMQARVRALRYEHSWEARARQVASDLNAAGIAKPEGSDG